MTTMNNEDPADPSWVDRHIATDIANNEAKVRAKSA